MLFARLQGNLKRAQRRRSPPKRRSTGNSESCPLHGRTGPPIVLSELEAEGHPVVRDLRTVLLVSQRRRPRSAPTGLCWVPGKPEVAWWHWAGGRGRRPPALSEPPRLDSGPRQRGFSPRVWFQGARAGDPPSNELAPPARAPAHAEPRSLQQNIAPPMARGRSNGNRQPVGKPTDRFRGSCWRPPHDRRVSAATAAGLTTTVPATP